jgi:polar amino acid transport system substrate-binding protein
MLAAACGSAGEPPNLAADVDAERPMPPGAGEPEEPGDASEQPDCGDPEVSLEPDGLDVPSGSTMHEIRQRGHLIAGVDQTTFLFGFRNPTNGELEGFVIEVARHLADELLGEPDEPDGNIVFKAITSADREGALSGGEVDVVVRTFTVNCERRENIEFSSVYFQAYQDLLVRRDSGISGTEDLEGEKACATHGSTSVRRIAEWGAEPVGVANWSDCLVLVQQGQVAAVTTDNSILAGMAEQDPALEVVGEEIAPEPYAIGIPQGNEDMVRYVNAVLEDFRDGDWQRIYNDLLRDVLGADEPPEPKYG